jgi:methylglutamate dehydrogenase subunit D
MESLSPTLDATPAFSATALARATQRNLDFQVSDRHGLGLAIVLARRAQITALKKRASENIGLQLPTGPHRASAGEIAFATLGPGAWLVMHERGGAALTATVKSVVEGVAFMTDQTGAYAVVRVSGVKVRDVLCKLVPLDLHPRVFKVGDVATTTTAHAAATLWRLEDLINGSPVFEMAVDRSFADGFWRRLSQSAACVL